MAEACDFAEHAVVRSDMRKFASRMMRRKHRSGEMISERRLTDSFRACDQPAVMQPAAPKRIFEFGQGCVMADRPLHLSRRGEAL